MVTGGMGDYLLICEGRCNPLLAEIDGAVARLGHPTERRYGWQAAEYQRVVAAQRTLTYTPHFRLSVHQATCRVCGTARWFGRHEGGA